MLTPEQLCLRPITPQDNAAVAELVIATLAEYQCIGPGFASSDPELHDLHAVYHASACLIPNRASDRGYWVVSDDTGRVWGGGGYSRLKGTLPGDGICELQKMYFHSALRGLGFGRKLLTHCLEAAKLTGYQTMYLETMPQMESALSLYHSLGFQRLPSYLGDTGHRACSVFMSRTL